MKSLKVVLYIPYGYYHTGDYTETFKWEVDDVVADIIKKVMAEKQVTVLNDEIIHEAISNGTKELQTLHDNLREIGYQFYVEAEKSQCSYYGPLCMSAVYEDTAPINYEFRILRKNAGRDLRKGYIESHRWSLKKFLKFQKGTPERNCEWKNYHERCKL